MAKAKYNTAEHKRLEREFARLIANGEGWCSEPVCLEDTRDIPPGTPRAEWHVPHAEDGVTYREGPAHAHCNTSEGATRGNAQRRGPAVTRWIL